MQLQPGERSILATFTFTHKAREAVRALHDAGFGTVQLDRFGASGSEPDHVRPGQGAVSQSAQVLFGTDAVAEENIGPLLAATPEASGMAGDITAVGEGLLLTAVVPAGRVDEALAIIRRHGGLT